MNIKFEFRDKEYFIESDKRNYIFHEGYKEYEGRKNMIEPSYFDKIEHLVAHVLDHGLKKSDATTLEEFMEDYKELKKLIIDKFDIAKKL